jgi:2-keto-4-pentenoate hydratase/2-oxohepta-3-ene-1,7-dioic acid hydratase in catechol pathway
MIVKFVSFQFDGRPSWGLVRDQAIVDLGAHLPRHSTLSDFLASPDFANRDAVVARLEPSIDLSEVRFEPVIPRPEKIICLSRNYMDHHMGTPSGVGWGRNPKVWLKAGDQVDVEIEGVGLLSNQVEAE